MGTSWISRKRGILEKGWGYDPLTNYGYPSSVYTGLRGYGEGRGGVYGFRGGLRKGYYGKVLVGEVGFMEYR